MDIRGLMPTAQSAWAFLKSVLWKTMTIKRLCDHNWFSSILSTCKWFTTFCHVIIFSHHLLYQLPEGKVGREEAQWVWVEMWTVRHNCSHQFLTSHGTKTWMGDENTNLYFSVRFFPLCHGYLLCGLCRHQPSSCRASPWERSSGLQLLFYIWPVSCSSTSASPERTARGLTLGRSGFIIIYFSGQGILSTLTNSPKHLSPNW